MSSPPPLRRGAYYHIFNRGNNGEDLFVENRNYSFFLERCARYIEPVAFTYAYCLMKNHFHLLIRTKTEEVQREDATALGTSNTSLEPSRQFGRLFNSYAKAFSRRYGRTGSLFEHPFQRLEVKTESHLQWLVAYVHRNPEQHGFVDDFRVWPCSSHNELASDRPTRLQRDAVIEWLGGVEEFLDFHASPIGRRRMPSIKLEG